MPNARAHILVVEDDRDLRDSLMEVLEAAGYSVAGAHDGLQALSHLRGSAQRPDMILLDLQMPNMNGVEFRGEQLKSGELAQIPVAVVTADANASEQLRGLSMAGLLRKPLKVPQLLALIPRVLASSRADRRAE